MLTIRNGNQEGRRIEENITWRAFYRIYDPGCVGHDPAHTMRDQPTVGEE